MTLKNTLRTLKPERLHVDSNRRLEEFHGNKLVGVLLLDEKNKRMSVSYDDGQTHADYEFQQSDSLVCDCHKVEYGKGTEDIELLMGNMKDGLESLKKLGLKNGPLMQRIICGIAIQYGETRVGPLMETAMRCAGLSVDKSGNIQQTDLNTNRGRSI